ncbi:hypothetical protein BsWGS_23391 [Bradybaena similaris]
MNAAAALLLIATTTVIKTECFRTFDKRQDVPVPPNVKDCTEDAARCAPTITQQQFLTGHSDDFGTLAPIIDQICVEYQTARQCLQPILDTCSSSYRDVLDSIYKQLDFLCSDQGKSLLREYQQSSCYRDFPGLGTLWHTCDLEEPGDPPAEHNAMYHVTMMRCLFGKFAARCGDAGGQILTSLFNIKFPQET